MILLPAGLIVFFLYKNSTKARAGSGGIAGGVAGSGGGGFSGGSLFGLRSTTPASGSSSALRSGGGGGGSSGGGSGSGGSSFNLSGLADLLKLGASGVKAAASGIGSLFSSSGSSTPDTSVFNGSDPGNIDSWTSSSGGLFSSAPDYSSYTNTASDFTGGEAANFYTGDGTVNFADANNLATGNGFYGINDFTGLNGFNGTGSYTDNSGGGYTDFSAGTSDFSSADFSW